MQKTSAWPLSLVYVALIVYASLYPFTDWRFQGVVPWAFLSSSWPKYWTGFDLVANALGYMPLGFLLVLSALRTGRARFAVSLATLVATLLSLMMESLQSYLPVRVPSNVDLGLNMLGAWVGGQSAWALEKLGWIDRWSRFRANWFVPNARGGLVLLALWPVALLFPAAVPFALGQVLERVEDGLASLLQDTPFLEWLPIRDVELQPLVPSMELACVTLGVLIPCLLGFGIIRGASRRAIFVFSVFVVGVGSSLLSATLSYGPEHAWAWFGLPVQFGLIVALVCILLLLGVHRRACSVLMLLSLGIYLSLVNQVPTSAYFAQTLSTWEQGRFIRFHGLAQWVGWIWPYAALVYVMLRLWAPEPEKLESPHD